MKGRRTIIHVIIVLAGIFLLVAAPILHYFPPVSAGTETDAVTSASLQLPDSPSGEFVILVNRGMHPDTLKEWESFFKDEDFAVIFEDIDCMVAKGDETAKQLAERFQAQLPENQMKLKTEDATLLVSKAEAGCIDVAVFSREMADALKLASEENMPQVVVIRTAGGQ